MLRTGGAHVRVRPDALRRHPSRPRGHLHHLRRASASPAGHGPRDPLRAQHHRRRRRHPGRGRPPRRPLPGPGLRRDGPLRRRHGRAQHLPPASEPRATSAIPDIRGFIHAALDRGFAYCADGSVYFDTQAFDGFGSLSGFGRDHMVALARQWRDNPDDPAKRDPLDFVLWQRARPGEPAWESRWGPGRPGWHVECSTLALRELGETIDLHGGGADLLYPHHECERAQSEAVTGKPFARHWLHQALVHYEGSKMSKSLGNLVFVHELRERHEPMAIRLALMSQHYRTPWPWHDRPPGGSRAPPSPVAQRCPRRRRLRPPEQRAPTPRRRPGRAGRPGRSGRSRPSRPPHARRCRSPRRFPPYFAA